MEKYKRIAKDAKTKLMYDQGEDRWLCTLISLSGGRIEYEARSRCKTFAPDDLDTFFKQRRRWYPSIILNAFELILSKNFGAKMSCARKTANVFYHMLSIAMSSIEVMTTLFVIWEGLENLSLWISSGKLGRLFIFQFLFSRLSARKRPERRSCFGLRFFLRFIQSSCSFYLFRLRLA